MWVAGCSTGEEVYSLVIALLEFMEKQSEHCDIQVFGSDINEKILARARAGVYPDTIAEDVSPERLSRYFTKTAAGYRISKAVRDMCIFARQDVTRDPPFSNIDLISCRNVMIYFDAALQKKVIPIFHYALRPQGFLVLGMAESIGCYSELFGIVDARHRVYARNASALRMAVVPSGFARGSALVSSVHQVVSRQVAEPMLSEVRKQADAIILSKFCPSGVVVNSSMQILQFRGQTGPFLENTPGDASLNLLKMARQGLAVELRPLISRAVKLKRAVEEVGVQVRENGRVLSVDLKVIPFSVPPGSELFFLILFTEKSSKALPAARKGRVSHASPLERELEQLRDEISASKLSLQTIIEEQEATNEELRAASEEALSSNEELQSTNEELETAKEELQSTNEELTTLNEELQNRNLELHQLSDDLINLFSSVDIPIVILGADLRIRRFTPKARIDDLQGMIDDVLESLTAGEHEVQDLEGRWHVLRIRPYKTMDNRIDGVVLTLLDVDALKRSLAEAQEARQFAEAVIATVREPLLVLDSALNVKMVNRSFCEFFRTRSQDVENKSIYELGDGHWDLPALRELLEKLLPTRSPFEGFRVEHEFPEIGKKELLLNARSMNAPGHQNQWILLAMEDITPSK
jgi:two-component system CheB/CheR fusion protein